MDNVKENTEEGKHYRHIQKFRQAYRVWTEKNLTEERKKEIDTWMGKELQEIANEAYHIRENKK